MSNLAALVPTPVTWVSVAEVGDALGISADDAEADVFLGRCTDAANQFGFRRRHQAGYQDDPAVSPGPDASIGVTFYAVALYRERGSVDSYASFDEFATGAMPSSSFGQVLRLLGVPKPAVDRLNEAELTWAYWHGGLRAARLRRLR